MSTILTAPHRPHGVEEAPDRLMPVDITGLVIDSERVGAALSALRGIDEVTRAAIFDVEYYAGWETSDDLVYVLRAFGFHAEKWGTDVHLLGLYGDWVEPAALTVFEVLAPYLPEGAHVVFAERLRTDRPLYALSFLKGELRVDTDVEAEVSYRW